MPVMHHPSDSEYLLTGLFGIAIYTVILYFSIRSISIGFRSKSTKRFFGTIMIMACLELPRFLALTITQEYTSRTAYSFHLASGIFFFLGFSIVCRQWSGLLQLGSYFRVVYGYNSLIVSNISFAVVDFISIIMVLLSSSLDAFFHSLSFEIITFIEGIRNMIYSAFLCYYGLKLVRRFWHFSTIERSNALKAGVVTTLSYYCPSIPFPTSDEQVFTKVVLRLTSVLLLTTFCFVFRVAMLIAKMAVLHNDNTTANSTSFKLFGFWWFMCSDFIPRALPSLAFIFLMRTKRPKDDGTEGGPNTPTRALSGQFQFVSLASEDLQPYEFKKAFDAPDASTESFLQNSQFEEEEVTVTLNRLHPVPTVEDSGELEEDDEQLDDPGEAAIDKIFSLLRFSSSAAPEPMV